MFLEQRVSILAKSALFHGLPADAVAELAANAVERRIRQGQILFTTNEAGLRTLYRALRRRSRPPGEYRGTRADHTCGTRRRHIGRGRRLRWRLVSFQCGRRRRLRGAVSGNRGRASRMLRYPQAALTALAIMAKKLRTVASLAEQLAEGRQPAIGNIAARRSSAQRVKITGRCHVLPAIVPRTACIASWISARSRDARATEASPAGRYRDTRPSDRSAQCKGAPGTS